MEKLGQMDLGATILSIALSAGFVAFGFLVLRILMIGIKSVINRLNQGRSIEAIDKNNSEKGFKEIEE